MNPTKLRTPTLIADEFLEQLKIGVHWGTGNRLVLRHVSDDGRFVIWTRPGGNVWNGMRTTKYHKSCTHLSDLSRPVYIRQGMVLFYATEMKKWEGRFGKKQKTEAMTMIRIATDIRKKFKKGLVK